MIPTNFLFHLADYEGIKIEWHPFTNTRGVYLHTPTLKRPIIALANDLHTNERELRCVLSHELGHHFKTAGNHLIAASTTAIYRTKNENLATKWAVNLLVPTDVFIHCVQRGKNIYELCNYFYVLPEFISIKSEMVNNDKNLADTLTELSSRYNVVF